MNFFSTQCNVDLVTVLPVHFSQYKSTDFRFPVMLLAKDNDHHNFVFLLLLLLLLLLHCLQPQGPKGDAGRDGIDGLTGIQGPPGHVFLIPVRIIILF